MGRTTASGFVIGRGTVSVLSQESSHEGLLLLRLWACGQGGRVVQAKRHVHSPRVENAARAGAPHRHGRLPAQSLMRPASARGLPSTTRVENAHGTGVREVLYRSHPWFGRDVHVHAAITKSDGVYFRCTLNGADGARWQELPAWMFDRAACAGSCMVAEPFVSLAALSALSRLLDAMGRPSPAAPQPPGLGAHSRLDRNRGEHHADGTSVTITHPAWYAATAGDDREAAPDRCVRRRH